jgi:hypothetical protein
VYNQTVELVNTLNQGSGFVIDAGSGEWARVYIRMLLLSSMQFFRDALKEILKCNMLQMSIVVF